MKTPFNNPNYFQSRNQYSGPISKNAVKIEISKERFVGPVVKRSVPRTFDYSPFEIGNIWTLSLLDQQVLPFDYLLWFGKSAI